MRVWDPGVWRLASTQRILYENVHLLLAGVAHTASLDTGQHTDALSCSNIVAMSTLFNTALGKLEHAVSSGYAGMITAFAAASAASA